jgi:soluble cytochrome b562
MKARFTLSIGACALSCLSFFAAPHAPATQDPAPAAKAEKAAQEPSLKDHMKAMKRAFTKVVAFAKGEGEAPLHDVAAMIEHATAARLLVPEMAADVAEAERPKFERAFRQSMRATVRTLLDLEDALDAGDTAKAKELIGTLAKAKEDNHKKFIKD